MSCGLVTAIAGEGAASLVDAYERLRHSVTLAHGRGCRGSLILLRGGMAAWMRAVETLPDRAASTSEASPIASPEALPADVERELIDVLASMALSTAGELRA